ncbi:hypothetical protein [Streptomyces chumphonensis]|uniref:hypothetical protein n=1 Tax=Streptomyces chumphonensis TaxID=1214925 RepID=UPI003D75A882
MITYAIGTYVVDTRSDTLGELMANEGRNVLLRPPPGGREWACPPEALRLATAAERHEAGIPSGRTAARRTTTA